MSAGDVPVARPPRLSAVSPVHGGATTSTVCSEVAVDTVDSAARLYFFNDDSGPSR
jgi:hypothetical protein